MKNNKGKGNKNWLWILLGIGCLPVILLIIGILILLTVFFIIFSDSKNENSISEYGESEIPAEFIPIYQEAGEEYNIDWILIAAIHKIETAFSTIDPMISSAGAEGHTQFMPCTFVGWSYPGCAGTNGNAHIPDSIKHNPEKIAYYGGYGVDGDGDGKADPFNIYDAIYSTANMLSANMNGSTEEERIRNAIYSYNRADWYVQEVLFYYDMFSNLEIDSGYVEVIGNKAWPVPYTKRITSHFDPNRVHPIYGDIRPHQGVDIADSGVAGKPIVAFADGIVLYSQANAGGFGNLTVIDHGNGLSTYYAHMMYQGLRHGTKVRAGQTIGYVGSTGNSTGPHLHFEIRINGTPVDPLPYLREFLN